MNGNMAPSVRHQAGQDESKTITSSVEHLVMLVNVLHEDIDELEKRLSNSLPKSYGETPQTINATNPTPNDFLYTISTVERRVQEAIDRVRALCDSCLL